MIPLGRHLILLQAGYPVIGNWLPPTSLSRTCSRLSLSLPDDSELVDVLSTLQPSGQISDIRVAASKDSALQFSFHVSQLGLKQWELLPGIHKLDAVVAGNTQGGRAMLNLKEDELPYGDVFQAPLNIDAADVTAYWQVGEDGWRLWSDKIDVGDPASQGRWSVPFGFSGRRCHHGCHFMAKPA